MKTSEFPEYFAECFSLPICQLHSGKKLELRQPGDVCCVVSSVIQSHTPGMEASPQGSPASSPFLGIQCGQQSLWKLELFGGKSGHSELGPRVNYRGNDPGLVSLEVAGPVSQHCSPLTSRR